MSDKKCGRKLSMKKALAEASALYRVAFGHVLGFTNVAPFGCAAHVRELSPWRTIRAAVEATEAISRSLVIGCLRIFAAASSAFVDSACAATGDCLLNDIGAPLRTVLAIAFGMVHGLDLRCRDWQR